MQLWVWNVSFLCSQLWFHWSHVLSVDEWISPLACYAPLSHYLQLASFWSRCEYSQVPFLSYDPFFPTLIQFTHSFRSFLMLYSPPWNSHTGDSFCIVCLFFSVDFHSFHTFIKLIFCLLFSPLLLSCFMEWNSFRDSSPDWKTVIQDYLHFSNQPHAAFILPHSLQQGQQGIKVAPPRTSRNGPRKKGSFSVCMTFDYCVYLASIKVVGDINVTTTRQLSEPAAGLRFTVDCTSFITQPTHGLTSWFFTLIHNDSGWFLFFSFCCFSF